VKNSLDDTEYIRNVRAVLEGVEKFLHNDRSVVVDPETVRDELHAFSKELWLEYAKKIREEDADEESGSQDEYYYDYIYNHGIYPC